MTDRPSNYEIALKAEMKHVIRCFQAYTSEQRANHAASFRLGYQQRQAIGKFFYTHPEIPNVAFETRSRAARAALSGCYSRSNIPQVIQPEAKP